jgi:hypothetical protein
MLKRIALGAFLLALLAVVALLPPSPGPITLADVAGACTPIQTDSGPVYPAGATIFDSTEHVTHCLTRKPTCPRGFNDMHILVVRDADSTGPPPKAWRCVRNVQELECPASSEPPAEPGAV